MSVPHEVREAMARAIVDAMLDPQSVSEVMAESPHLADFACDAALSALEAAGYAVVPAAEADALRKALAEIAEKFAAWSAELRELAVLAKRDAEFPHVRADEILCECLRYMHPACAGLADEFDKIRKWYA